MNETELWEAAWWSAVAEPADPCARVVRRALATAGVVTGYRKGGSACRNSSSGTRRLIG